MTNKNIDVLLISMPWGLLTSPSIQLGTLQSILEQNEYSVQIKNYYVDAAEYFAENVENFSYDEYHKVASSYNLLGVGDWLFSTPPFSNPNPDKDADYIDYLKKYSIPEDFIDKLYKIRSISHYFLENLVKDISLINPKVIGFSTTFCQNVSSLKLSLLLKQSNPDFHIIFGGANCDGPMGEAIIKAFPYVDTVFRGESETTLPQYLKKIIRGDDTVDLRQINGLGFRENGKILMNPQTAPTGNVNDIPLPNYDSYFNRIKETKVKSYLIPRISLPFESSRGCWWGEKHHCTFCGLNGTTMAYRSKNPDLVLDEIVKLVSRYQITHLSSVDNIISMNYITDLLPKLRDLRAKSYDFRIFYETKVNLKKEQIKLMSEAGINRIQPGVESLSTPILKLMRKGTTALQNVRFLKWATQYNLKVSWNIIYGFPNEPIEEYEKMAELIPSLFHLIPPNLSRLGINRFSPYHNAPDSFGIELTGPAPHYRFNYDLDEETLNGLAYDFDFKYTDNKDLSYTDSLKDAVHAWQDAFNQNATLFYERGIGFLRIYDNRRRFDDGAQITLKEIEAEIYLACDKGAKVKQIKEHLEQSHNVIVHEDQIEAFLEKLLAGRLLVKENDVYLSLALPLSSLRKF